MSGRALEEAARILVSGGVGAEELDPLRRAAGENPEQLVLLARRRAEGVPLALLTGRQEFLGIELLTAPDVIVPRAETELLGRAAIEAVRRAASERGTALFADICCGSGNVACAVALEIAEARGWACDLAAPSVELARRNVEHLGLGGRVEVLQGDLLAPLAALALGEGLDAIVCNPPYISSGRLQRDRAHLLIHEPREAFDGGPYGLSIHQRVVREASRHLRPGGTLLMEVGEGQATQVMLLLQRAGSWEQLEARLDTAGVARAILARRKAG
jgi:release factor glutamine methyltransferase